MIVPIKQIGSVGVNADLSHHELPIQAWTDARNIRFLDGYARQMYGHSAVYDPPSVKPYHVLPVSVSGTKYWIYAGSGKVYCVNGSTHTDLTRASGGDYTGAINKWTSTTLSGIPIINDGSGSNYPQSWDLNIANKFVNLPNWTANDYCKALRTYKTYLVALNITRSGTKYPYLVKWSHPADPGAVPASWDKTDTTKDAGEIDLAEGADAIVDGLALGSSFMIYKENSTFRMDHVGGVFVHRFTKVVGQGGALGLNCIQEANGMHFVVGGNDIYIHDGSSPRSVLDKMTRRHLFANIDSTNAENTFTVKNPYYNEIWACYPENGNTIPNMACVWNYVDNTVTFREIPSLYHANSGLMESTIGTTWDSDSDTWDSDVTTWDQTNPNPSNSRLVMASDNTKLYLADATSTFDGTAVNGYMERRGLSLGEPDKIKLVRGVRSRIKGVAGETVIVKIGSQDDEYSAPRWTTTTYTIGSTVSCDCLVSGRYIAIRFETGTAKQWALESYDLDYVLQGLW